MNSQTNARATRLARDEFLRFTHCRWAVLAVAALFVAGDLAVSEDSDLVRKVDAAIGNRRSSQEAYGLLVGRYPISEMGRSEASDKDDSAELPGARDVRAASWITGMNDSGPPPAQLPSPSDPVSSYVNNSGTCSTCNCCNPL